MNTEPDEYRCACPDGYSGKKCEIGISGYCMYLWKSETFLGMAAF